MSAFGSELRNNCGKFVATIGTTIMQTKAVPIHQAKMELRFRLKALLVAQSGRHSQGEFGFASLIASSCFSCSYPYMAPTIKPTPISAKTEAKTAPAIGFLFSRTAGVD